jgi:hypothetical protein
MRRLLAALAIGTVIGLSPVLSEKADAQRFGRGGGVGIGGGGIGRVGGIGGGIGRVGIAGPGIGRVGVGSGIGRVGWVGRPGIGGVGVRYAGLGAGYGGWGVRRAAWWGGYPGWRVRRAAWWGAPLAFGIGLGAVAYGSCYRWDPYYGTYVNVCYSPYYGGYSGQPVGGGGGQWYW